MFSPVGDIYTIILFSKDLGIIVKQAMKKLQEPEAVDDSRETVISRHTRVVPHMSS